MASKKRASRSGLSKNDVVQGSADELGLCLDTIPLRYPGSPIHLLCAQRCPERANQSKGKLRSMLQLIACAIAMRNGPETEPNNTPYTGLLADLPPVHPALYDPAPLSGS